MFLYLGWSFHQHLEIGYWKMGMGHFKNTYRLFFFNHANISLGFPGSSDGKEFACNAGDPGLIPGSRRSPREENGYPL